MTGPLRRIVVAGAGLAGHRAAVALRERGFDGELVVVGDESRPPYDRPPLSKQVLAGSFTAERCAYPVDGLDVTWRLGAEATGLDRAAGTVGLSDGSTLAYDGLVIATGRRARPWSTALPPGAQTLRTLDDALALRAAAVPDARVVIVGAGFIGCEVAASLRGLGVRSVTVVDVAPHPMPVLGPEVGPRVEAVHRAHGVDFRLGGGVDAILGTDRVEGVLLATGELLPADVVLVATGTLPNTGWLAGAGLRTVGGAVAVDGHCRAVLDDGGSAETIVAAGDVAAWVHPHGDGTHASVEHWANAGEMSACAAANLLLPPAEGVTFVSVPTFWSDFFDVKLRSAGNLRAATSWRVVDEDPDKPSLVVEALRGDDVVGAVGLNAARAVMGYARTLLAAG